MKTNAISRIVTPELAAAIADVVDYSLSSEKADYEEQDAAGRSGHIYERLTQIRAWLDAERSAEFILENRGFQSQTYTLERFYSYGNRTLRVQLVRNVYDFQSRAIVEASTPDGAFGKIMDYPPANWYAKTPDCVDKKHLTAVEPGFAALRLVADEMVQRVLRILPA
jgi:hypothetical protein